MLRFLAGVGSALLLVLTGFFVWKGIAQREDSPIPPAPSQVRSAATPAVPPRPPAADERTKEQRRFDRGDRDKNGRITLDELYQPRRKAYERLDVNRDGRLSFEEWAIRTANKFGEADRNRDGHLDRTEYAATPRPQSRRQNCAC